MSSSFAGVPYRVYLPDWVLVDPRVIRENALKYLSNSYPECLLIEVTGRYAICRRD